MTIEEFRKCTFKGARVKIAQIQNGTRMRKLLYSGVCLNIPEEMNELKIHRIGGNISIPEMTFPLQPMYLDFIFVLIVRRNKWIK